MKAMDIRRALACGRSGCKCSRSELSHCPSHTDGEPSFSVRDGHSGVLFTCFTGCDRPAVIAALKDRGLWEASSAPRSNRLEPVAEYKYIDAHGNLIATKGRFERHEDGELKKWFWWLLPGAERWGRLDGMDTATFPLYRLPAALQRPTERVWFVEGEKAADALHGLGLVAVTLCGGAAMRRWGNALDPLRDRRVALWPDRDDAGEKFMEAIREVLPQAVYVRPALGPKEDAADYVDRGGTVAGLLDLLPYEPEPIRTRAVGMRRPFLAVS